MHRKRLNGQGGFSLIELIIVIAVLGILGAIASYSYMGYVNNSNLRSAARDMAADMANTRQKAVSEGLTYRTIISVGANTYTIERGDAAGAAFTVVETKSPTAFGTGLTISSTNYTSSQITYRPRGTISAGNVVLINSRDSTATITSNITGRTHVSFTIK